MKFNSLRDLLLLSLCCIGLCVTAQATDRHWTGSGGNPDISTSGNWSDGQPNSGDDLYFDNTVGGHIVNSNYSTGSYFGLFTTYNGAGGIKLTGDKTYLYKFENYSDSNLLEATATLSNRTGPDSNLEINPVGSGGVKVANVDIQNGKSLLVYGNNQLEVTGTISQSGTGNASLTLNGAATVLLQSANTYGGSTTLNAGTLLANGGVAGTSSATGSGAVLVNNSGTLGGTGAISGGVTVASGGTLNSGPSGTAATAGAVGTLHTGALTLQSGSFSNFDVSGTTTYDQLVSSGAIAFGGTLDVNIASGLHFTSGQTLNLFSGISETGTFSGIADNQLVTFDGYSFTADYTGTGFTLTAVPEPSTWIAAALALGAIAWTQRRRFRALLPS